MWDNRKNLSQRIGITAWLAVALPGSGRCYVDVKEMYLSVFGHLGCQRRMAKSEKRAKAIWFRTVTKWKKVIGMLGIILRCREVCQVEDLGAGFQLNCPVEMVHSPIHHPGVHFEIGPACFTSIFTPSPSMAKKTNQ